MFLSFWKHCISTPCPPTAKKTPLGSLVWLLCDPGHQFLPGNAARPQHTVYSTRRIHAAYNYLWRKTSLLQALRWPDTCFDTKEMGGNMSQNFSHTENQWLWVILHNPGAIAPLAQLWQWVNPWPKWSAEKMCCIARFGTLADQQGV